MFGHVCKLLGNGGDYTSAWLLCARCDGIGSIGNCSTGKRRLPMESTLINMMVAIQTCLGIPVSYLMLLECITAAWPLCARFD